MNGLGHTSIRINYSRLLLFVCILTIGGIRIVLAANNATGVAQQIQLSTQMALGVQGVYPNVLIQYQEPTTTTAQYSGSTIVIIPHNTTGNVVSCATLFPGWNTPIAVGLQDVTNPGQQVNVGTAVGDTRIPMAASGFFIYRVAGTTIPVFYIDNPSATQDAAIQVMGLSN